MKVEDKKKNAEFNDEEKKTLSEYVTDYSGNIFVLKNLPEIVKGALFSRYSRSSKSLRRILIDEFVGRELEKADAFYERVLIGYGDDSIAELAGTHIALENVSILATKYLEDSRIGISPLEKSTRYVYFDKKINGDWLYLKEEKIMDSKFGDEYIKACNFLFERYSELIPKISKYIMEKNPQGEGISERAYSSTIRATSRITPGKRGSG